MTTARRAFEVTDVPAVKPLDYVRFHALIETVDVKVKGSVRKIATVKLTGGGWLGDAS